MSPSSIQRHIEGQKHQVHKQQWLIHIFINSFAPSDRFSEIFKCNLTLSLVSVSDIKEMLLSHVKLATSAVIINGFTC